MGAPAGAWQRPVGNHNISDRTCSFSAERRRVPAFGAQLLTLGAAGSDCPETRFRPDRACERQPLRISSPRS